MLVALMTFMALMGFVGFMFRVSNPAASAAIVTIGGMIAVFGRIAVFARVIIWSAVSVGRCVCIAGGAIRVAGSAAIVLALDTSTECADPDQKH